MIIQSKKNSVVIGKIELVFFMFSMIFLGEINGLDIRIPIYLFWLLYSVIKRTQSNFLFSKKQIVVVFLILILLAYSALVLFFSDNTDTFYLLKILRCVISTVVIFFFFSNSDINLMKLAEAYIVAASIQALAVIGGLLSPQIREFISIFSGYSKKYLPFRSSGLFSGYDYAGYFINLAVFIYGLILIRYPRRKIQYFFLVLLMISVILTSRFNSIILVGDLFVLLLISIKSTNKLSKMFFLFIDGIVTVVGIIFMIISTNISPNLKYGLITNVPFIGSLSETMTDSYANYNVSETIVNQFNFPTGTGLFFGKNIKAPVDPGYVNTIYYIGILGLLLVLTIYLFIAMSGLSKKDKNGNIIILYLFFVTLLFEIKLSFLFSSGSFELLIIFWTVVTLRRENTNRRYIDDFNSDD